MATAQTITLIGNSGSFSTTGNQAVGAFQDLDLNDDVFDDAIIQKVTRGLFTNNAPSLTTFFTSSTQAASSGQYYYDVYNKVAIVTGKQIGRAHV